jgi:nucleotide-binding universal stress UspA family protein
MLKIAAFINVADRELTSQIISVSRRVAALAKARLILICVEFPDAEFEAGELRKNRSRAATAQQLRQDHRALHILEIELQHLKIDATAVMVRGTSMRANPAKKVLQKLHHLKPDLIVVGCHQYGLFHHLLYGSVSNSVIRHAEVPVLVVPSKARVRRRREGPRVPRIPRIGRTVGGGIVTIR